MTSIAPLTEADIAEFLVQTPGFFERHAELLASIQLTSPHGGRAISLQERQAEMLRDKIKVLEQRLMEFVRYGNENMLIGDRLQHWSEALFRERDAATLPRTLLASLKDIFGVPQAVLKLWDLAPEYAAEPYAQEAGEGARSLANSLTTPYCGVNSGLEVVRWFGEPDAVASLALLPLRVSGTAFGLLVLASPDGTRYQADMATDFLERIAALASAALARLRAA